MTRQRIGKGKPLEELTKGSYDYALHRIRRAFYRAFPDSETEWYWVEEVFADYVVVNGTGLAVDEFYRVTYAQNGDSYDFAPRDRWEVVELTYRPRTAPGSLGESKDKGSRLIVEEIRGVMEFAEATEEQPNLNGPWRVKAVGVTADVVNANGRRYPGYATGRAVREAKRRIQEDGPGKLTIGGEIDHPGDKGTDVPLLSETVFNWDKLEFKEGKVLIEGVMFGTQAGKDMYARMQGDLKPDISQRAFGQSIQVEEDGEEIEEVVEFFIAGYDAVAEGSDPLAGVEQIESKTGKEIPTMSKDNQTTDTGQAEELARARLEKEKVLNQGITSMIEGLNRSAEIKAKVRAFVLERKPEDLDAARSLMNEKLAEYDAVVAESHEQDRQLRLALGLSETDDLAAAVRAGQERTRTLEEAEQSRQMEKYIEEECGKVNYPDHLKEAFIKAVKADSPKTVEEAKAAIAKHKAIYGDLAAKDALRLQGFGVVQVVGPVIERTGYPEFAMAAHAINESMFKQGKGKMHGYFNKPVEGLSPNQKFARLYLEKFDAKYGHILAEEARRFNEAQLTTDMDLPYSVLRAVIPEAIARLVALSVFDVGQTDQAPSVIFYEDYSDESGATVSVTNESVTADSDTWVDMDYARVQPGTVVVTDSTGVTTYTEGTDYVIDYGNGKLMALSAGSITDGQALLVDYTYDAIRKGENTAIERGKQTLTSKTLNIKADRLASEITNETVVFSRSQLGYDAVTRNLAGLTRRIAEKIDKDMFYLALTAALLQASNSGGTWNSSANPIAKLVEYIGYARVKVANRFYEPTSILMSLTNSDRLSNWEGFTQAGSRADADLNGAGYVGRLKGLPCFETTQLSDSYIVVCNREVVMHRIYQPAAIKGPYPSYSSNQLVAAEQYYIEEYNGTDAPVPEKASYVGII